MSDHGSLWQRAWFAPSLLILLAAAALVAGAALRHWTKAAVAREALLQADIRSALDDRGASAVPACAPEVDYAWALPATIPLDKLVQSLQDAAHAFGATLVTVGGEPHPATARSLATLGVSISLRGSYPALKSTLAEGLSRFPTAALQQMHFKRAGAGQPGVEEATLQVVFVLRPEVRSAQCRLSPSGREVMESTWQ